MAQGKAEEYSDLDLVIVVDALGEIKRDIQSKISELEWKYHLSIDPLILKEEDFRDNTQLGQGGIIYGLAEGCEVLMDKTGKITQTLQDRVEEIRNSHNYLKGVRIWVKAK